MNGFFNHNSGERCLKSTESVPYSKWGNFVDIIRYVKNPAWSYQEAKQKVDYFAGE